jgi:putative modified peptide
LFRKESFTVNVRTASVRAFDREQAVTSVLLHRLSSDDEFRDRFASRPREVLAEYGVAAPADTPLRLTLPPKERFHAVLEEAVKREVCTGAEPGLFTWVI